MVLYLSSHALSEDDIENLRRGIFMYQFKFLGKYQKYKEQNTKTLTKNPI